MAPLEGRMSEDAEQSLPDKMFFRIGEAAKLVGVEPHVLRYWEGEFKLRPQRSSSGQRMYRRKDLAKFIKIRRLLHDEGFTIAGARKALVDGPPAKVSPSPNVDLGRANEALKQIESLRLRIAQTRSRFSSSGIAAKLDEG